MTKADFIRSLPHLAPIDVVQRGKKQGIRLTLQNVYAQRHAEKQRATIARLTIADRPAPVTGDREKAFQRLALRIGITRAQAIIKRLDAAIDADDPVSVLEDVAPGRHEER